MGDAGWKYTLPDGLRMPGYKRPCRFCGQLVDETSNTCPFCGRAHPLQMVCPYCMAPVQANWVLCNTCGKNLTVPCPKCGTPAGPDNDVCANCHTVIRYRCPTCAAVISPGAKTCARCGAHLKDFWKSRGL